jgi:hypothetical protein
VCARGPAATSLPASSPPDGTRLTPCGYDSVTLRHDVGVSTWEHPQPLVVLHVGDLDPHGQAIYQAAAEDVRAWAGAGGGQVSFVRLAVTPAQVDELALPDDPTHPGSVQAEAIPPATMTELLREAIEDRLDREAFAGLSAHESELRSRLVARLDDALDE